LVAHPLATAAIWARSQIASKNTKWATSAKEWPTHSLPPQNIQQIIFFRGFQIRDFPGRIRNYSDAIPCVEDPKSIHIKFVRYSLSGRPGFSFVLYHKKRAGSRNSPSPIFVLTSKEMSSEYRHCTTTVGHICFFKPKSCS
jgi:hypothetical protein